MASGGYDHTLQIWDVDHPGMPVIKAQFRSEVKAIAASESPPCLAAAAGGSVTLLKLAQTSDAAHLRHLYMSHSSIR